MRIVVIGAGITGMFVSYYLRKDGYDVTLVEKASPISSASVYNAGILTSTFTPEQYAFPISFWYVASTVFRRRGPVYISPKQVLENPRWFMTAVRRGKGINIGEIVRQLAVKSMSMYKDFFREESIDVDLIQSLIGLYENSEVAQKAAEALKARFVDEREIREMGFDNLGGGVIAEDDFSLNPPKIFRGLRKKLTELGVNMEIGDKVRLVVEGRKVTSVAVDGRAKDADACVVSAGASCKELLQPLGFNPRILPAIGRVLIFETGGARIIDRPAGFEDLGMTVVQHNQNTFRATSFFELQGFNTTFPEDRKKWLLKMIRRHVQKFGQLKLVEEGVGLRPCSPDQVPIIGIVPGYENLYVASGNCRTGMTLAPATAYVIHSLIAGREPNDVPWRSFEPSRFS